MKTLKKFNLILLNLLFFVSSIFSAEKKEEHEGKTQAKIFYAENIVNNKFDAQDDSILLQYLYYLLKAYNAEAIASDLKRIFGKTDFLGKETAINFWLKKFNDALSSAGNEPTKAFLNKNRDNEILDNKYIRAQTFLLKHFAIPIINNKNNDFRKGLYTLLYNSIKGENPELLTIKYGDDAGKQLPTPESLDLPLFYWKRHGFENYEVYKNE